VSNNIFFRTHKDLLLIPPNSQLCDAMDKFVEESLGEHLEIDRLIA